MGGSKRAGTAGLAIAAWLAADDVAASELVMFGGRGCAWCARFDAEIAPVYAKTEEGRRAPLRRVELEAGTPDGLVLAAPVRFTPTFVLVDEGREVGRIQGYPGEDFFWGLLGTLLERLPAEPARGAGEG
ncbi:MAG: thioredoxin family protein [Geminicoccaceae bacterium]|nr:thioredoxin family protein [Geminicoccaceae bacterium]MCX8101810.1 thioredoxin family protein [Geminicoccaceae bacterium]MDW8369656.1 thioredoxin family protein [Geminicoccaceae bacterium]